MIGNGDQLSCKNLCNQMPITLHNIQFHAELLYPSVKRNKMLGVQWWLKTLRTMLTDYSSLIMKFMLMLENSTQGNLRMMQ